MNWKRLVFGPRKGFAKRTHERKASGRNDIISKGLNWLRLSVIHISALTGIERYACPHDVSPRSMIRTAAK
jgi:hypothetical protein